MIGDFFLFILYLVEINAIYPKKIYENRFNILPKYRVTHIEKLSRIK